MEEAPALHLVARDPELAKCWNDAFAGHDGVDVVLADILDVAKDTLVSPANSMGHMDGGIDRLYSEFFGPEVQERVYEAIAAQADGHLPVGAALLVRTGHPRIPRLVVAPTMTVPGPVPAAHAFFAMTAVLRIAVANRALISDVYCPGLCTGIGEVPAAEAAREMAAAFEKWKNPR